MNIILTHERADCDAIASLLAMHLLEPDAIPILPRQINRNIQQFLLLYDRAWGFWQRDDIPRGQKIELAWVVDTQRFDMVRGMNQQTPIFICDHHAKNDDLPPHYVYTGEPTGANVTLLVEKMLERGIKVEGLEATLLLLGIYEDTGNLIYKSTTPRDLQAAAWLLERGADLDIVRQFSQHPMSSDQIELMQRLEESAVVYTVKGHMMVIASAKLETPISEVAVIAYQLIQLFGGDALIIALQMPDHVQLIARAIVDDVDLGGLLRHFGGNGHRRAAAALLRNISFEETLTRLLDLIPEYTQPAIRVAALMSLGVQTVESQLSIAEAQARMNETGHEGYPVLEDNQLVGLLTRRAVDRAMLHNLQKMAVHEVMDAGTHHVTPATPVEELKDQMLNTGWGQMPVLDENGKLLGIVTRTDLIKHWGRRPDDSSHQHIQRFRQVFSENLWHLLEIISEAAETMNKGLFLVGGIVRDLLLERPNLDIDLVVEGNAIKLAEHLHQRYGGHLHTHQQFGTATWKISSELFGFSPEEELPPSIDFATSRAEFYDAPTALPTVRRGSIKLDLHRRDFSINALAIRLAPRPMGQLLDFYNGERDLHEGRIRVLHSLSFIDDPTRMLRAVRFEQRFHFQIEPRTEALIQSALPLLERVSGERLRHELELILAEPNPLGNLYRLQNLGILEAIHPNLQLTAQNDAYFREIENLQNRPPWELPADFNWIRLRAALLTCHFSGEEIQQIGKRLTLSRATLNDLLATQEAVTQLAQLSTWQPSEVVQHYESFGELAWLAAWIVGDHIQRHVLEKLATIWHGIKTKVNGDDLIRWGLPRGRRIGQLLWELRAGWLDEHFQSESDEHGYALAFIARHASDTDD